ncbi:MAG: hypothetical protein E7262_08335 [Lachnospiraceae bacterium]|nr:hypothetical protein [Lachnospiraceae bacterium]
MKKIIKYSALVLLMATTVVFSGCKEKETGIDENNNTKQALNKKMNNDDVVDDKIQDDAVMISVGGIDVTYSEAMVYVMLYKSEYENLMSNDIWAFRVEKGKTFEHAAKECVINQIVRSKVIEYGAQKIGVQIEPDEKIEIEDKAIECYEKVFKKLEGKYGITQAVVKDVMYDNYLAEKVYEVATNEVDVVVKDSDSRVPVVKQIEVLFKGYDKDGHKIERSKQTAHELIVEASNKLKLEDTSFSEVALEYSDAKDIEVIVKSDVKNKSYRKAATALNEEETSDILEMSNGYCILYCVKENDEEHQRENIEQIITKRQDDIFAKAYDEWLNKNDIYIVSDLWNMVNIADC